MNNRSLFHPDDASAVLPAAQAALADLRARGLHHRYVRHVRSSQAFALNLFAPLDSDAVQHVFVALGHHDIETVEPPVFEYEDVDDRLAETSPRSQHRTQVDVLLQGTTSDRRRIAALIEVKLGETNFGSCSAFDSPDNPDRNNCHQPGLFGQDASRCFQLANHGRGHRRYDEYLQHIPLGVPALRADDGGCWVRAGRNQPMRNFALAHVLLETGQANEVVYALCAPAGHTAMWRRFTEFRSVFHDTTTVTTRSLSAETVAAAHNDGGTELQALYAPALSDRALLHLSTDGTTLLGVWLHRDGHLTSYYAIDTEAEAEYAETVLLGRDWNYLIETLPQKSPYRAWWETTSSPLTEPIEDTFDRVNEERFGH